MTAKDNAKLGKLLARFLIQFADFFARPAGRELLQVYVQGLLSSVQRRNAEAIALDLIDRAKANGIRGSFVKRRTSWDLIILNVADG